MATAPAPPPPPPPPSLCTNLPDKSRSPPCPQHAAIPFETSPPVQETSPSSGTLQEISPATQQLPVENGLQGPPSEGKDNPSDSEDKSGPVQETDPAPQALNGILMTEQDGADTQMDEAGED
ncbi:WAS/WASL-interacting protein family member 3-like [Morone saxatilis]|uniref:WAS/WASL-interacting protein family member 3-like n=1 Tax=Morone saxatilis TaxID=34816 RepID=UPI0015E1C66C|nr:WAS/WASL-interacting protein family member 3-like [Morone saxatilis]